MARQLVVAAGVGAGTGIALWVAFQAGSWLFAAGTDFYFRAMGWRETKRARRA